MPKLQRPLTIGAVRNPCGTDMSKTVFLNIDLKDGQHQGVQVDDQHLLVARINGEYYVTSNICSHARVLLSKGKLRGTTIICPLHGARFDITSGQCLGGPTQQPITRYRAQVETSGIMVTLPD